MCYDIKISGSDGAVEYTDCNSAERYDSTEACPGYDTEQSDGEVPVMLEHCGMRSTHSWQLLPSPPLPGVVAPDRVLSMGQKELSYELMLK